MLLPRNSPHESLSSRFTIEMALSRPVDGDKLKAGKTIATLVPENTRIARSAQAELAGAVSAERLACS